MCAKCHKRPAVVFVTKLENGKRYYTFEQLKRIAIALDTSMDYLAGLTDDPTPYPRKSEP